MGVAVLEKSVPSFRGIEGFKMANKEVSERQKAEWFQKLLIELASELDLHYENDEFFALSPTIEVMMPVINYLKENGYEIPTVVEHVLRRYNRARN